MMANMKKLFIPVLTLLVLGAFAGWYWNTYMRGYISTDDALVDSYQATISPKVLGKIASLDVKEGDMVQAGQVVVHLDDSTLDAQANQNSAGIQVSEQDVQVAKVALEQAQNDLKRYEPLYQEGLIKRVDYDHYKSAVEADQAIYDKALAAVNAAQKAYSVTTTQMKDTKIYAPISGVISKRWVMPGDVVQPSQPIFSIFDLKNVWITANFEETKLSTIHMGQPVEIAVDAYPDVKFVGKVIEIGHNTASQFSLIPPNNASGNFTKVTQRVPVKIAILSHIASKPLLPGMSVEVKVKVN